MCYLLSLTCVVHLILVLFFVSSFFFVDFVFFFQAEDGIRYLVRSRGLGDVYKRQALRDTTDMLICAEDLGMVPEFMDRVLQQMGMLALKVQRMPCLLYTSDAADERSSVDLGGRRIIKKNKRIREAD